MTASLPLVTISETLYRYILKASPDNSFVSFDRTTGQYTCGPKGYLRENVDEDKDNGSPWVRVEDETDISERLGSPTPLFTMNIGVGYNDESCGGLFVIEGAVLEYRNNIGIVTTKTFANRSAQIGYLVTYASVGIPEKRYEWLIGHIEQAGVQVGDDEQKPMQHNNGKVWITANITNNTKPVMILRSTDGTPQRGELAAGMAKIQRNVVGFLFATMTLKRVATSSGIKHKIGMSIKAFQAIDITDICSPPLVKVGTFNAVPGGPTAKRLLDLVMPASSNPNSSSIAPSVTTSATFVGAASQ